MSDTQTTLRETVAEQLRASSEQETAPQPEQTAQPAEQTTGERSRDEHGRFAPKTVEQPQGDVAQVTPATDPGYERPSTWKKDYWPLWDKLNSYRAGAPVTFTPDEAKQLAGYNLQRETEFKTGVSTYKAEADQARKLNEAIAPFMPELQKYNIDPGQWIANLGRAHQVLAMGSPQQKVEMFHRLAREYGVPLGQQAQQQPDPQSTWAQEQISQLRNELQSFKTTQQQQEQAQVEKNIKQFEDAAGPDGKPLHPHFEMVKAQMGGLLRSGMAQDLQDAYDKAVWLNPEARQAEQARQAQQQAADAAQRAAATVAKAKAAAVSPKSASPSVQVSGDPKDLKSMVREAAASQRDGRV